MTNWKDTFLITEMRPGGPTNETMPAAEMPHLLIMHVPTTAQFRAYRRHLISAADGVGRAYYDVCDMRGWPVGTANTLSGLLYLLNEAASSMSNLFAGEAGYDIPKQGDTITSSSTITKEHTDG